MRFFAICASALMLLSGVATALQNPIIFPGTGAQVTAGQTYTITWNVTTSGSVTLALLFGPQRNLVSSAVIAVAIENDGTSVWTVPTGIGNGEWTIQITDSLGNVNYSPMFTVSGGSGTQGVAAVTSTVVAATATFTPKITGAVPTSMSVITSIVTTVTAPNPTADMTVGRPTSGAVPGNAGQLSGQGVAAIMGLGVFALLT